MLDSKLVVKVESVNDTLKNFGIEVIVVPVSDYKVLGELGISSGDISFTAGIFNTEVREDFYLVCYRGV